MGKLFAFCIGEDAQGYAMRISLNPVEIATDDLFHFVLAPKRRVERLPFPVKHNVLTFGPQVVICEGMAGSFSFKKEINRAADFRSVYSVNFP